jgi:simple sugar transport system permease protein
MNDILAAMISSTLAVGALIVIAGLGEVLAERTGVINLGIEGAIAIGAAVALLIAQPRAGGAWLGVLGGAGAGLLMGLAFGVLAVRARANQYIAGLGLGLLGVGLANQLGRPIAGRPAAGFLQPLPVPGLSGLPLVGEAVFDHNALVYLAYFVLPAAAWYLLFKTRHGLAMRAVGQDPAAADAAGLPVARLRILYAAVGGLLFGLAGAYLGLGLTRAWSEGLVAGKGWIALTLVFFSGWNPVYLVLGALFFGAATSLGFILQLQGLNVSPYLLGLLPYLATLVLIAAAHLLRRDRGAGRRGVGPAALGLPYYRD